MAKYRVRNAGDIANVYREKGDVIDLTAAQAKYLAPPLGGRVEPFEEATAPVADLPGANGGSRSGKLKRN